MEPNEWIDGQPGDPDDHNPNFRPLPPAPLPAHERAWRHPSELGGNTVELVMAPQPSMSRKATVVTVAVGVLLVAGAVRLLVPSTSTSNSAGVSTALTFAATSVIETITSSAVPSDESTPTSAPARTQQEHPPLTMGSALRASTTLADDVTSGRPTPVSVDLSQFGTLGDDTTAYAVVLNSGRFLATTAAALGDLQSVDVHLPSGETTQANVVAGSGGPIALLELSGTSADAAPHGELPLAGDTVTVGAPNGSVLATVGYSNDSGYPELLSEESLHESGPVYDRGGVLVGICTHDDVGGVWLLPVEMLDDLAAQQPTATSTIPASAPTSSTSTSTTSTTTAPTSTVTSTTTAGTSIPATSTPRSTVPSTSVPASATPTTVG